MESFVAIVHVLTALSIIALVLLQDSKSDGLGGAFGGGGSNSILGATGASTLAQKLTRAVSVIFAITSISLTMMSNKRNSVVDNLSTAPAAAATAPAPAQPADATSPTKTSLPPASEGSATSTPAPAK